MLLELNDVYVNYNHIKALQGISLNVREGEIVALIGANGAGKSTALNAISGLLKKAGGNINYEGKDITGHSPQRIVRSGIIQVPEGRAILTTLKVRENLEMGAFTGKSQRMKEDMEKRTNWGNLLAPASYNPPAGKSPESSIRPPDW